MSFQIYLSEGLTSALIYLLIGHLVIFTLLAILAMFVLMFGWWVYHGTLWSESEEGEMGGEIFTSYALALSSAAFYAFSFDWPPGFHDGFFQIFTD